MVKELKHTRYVYHYTSLEALFAILENYRKDINKDDLVFRASNIYKVNDPKEMEAGYSVVKSFLQRYEKENVPELFWLYDIANNKENEQKCKNDYIHQEDYIVGTGIIPYTVSFSSRRDYLPMWSLYGKTGKGVCLKFDAYKIIKDNTKMQVGFVAYDNKSCLRSMKEIIPQLYQWYMNDYKDKLEKLSNEKKLQELATMCLSASPYIKYKDYQYEKEFRLTYLKHYGNINKKISFSDFSMGYKVEPYVKVPISVCALKEIIMGPSMDGDTMKNVIKSEMDICNIQVRVSKSKVPFRI